LILLLALVLGQTTQAQEPEKPVTFRAIAVGGAVSSLLYEMAPGKPVAVSAGGANLSRPYPRPPGGNLVFYREVPPAKPGDKPARVPLANAHLGNEGPYLVVLAGSHDRVDGPRVTVLVFDDSWLEHPMQTARVFNFSRRKTVLQVEGQTQELPTAEAHLFPYPAGKGAMDFKAAFQEENGWSLRVVSPRGVIPNTRLTVIITDVIPTPDEPNPTGVNVTDVFDFTPQPPPPKPNKDVAYIARP